MSSPTAKFLKGPVKFMASHLVIVEIGSLTTGPMTVQFVTDGTSVCRTKLGRIVGKGIVPVCKLVPAGGTADAIDIFWLPYKPNDKYHLPLDHTRRFLFTPTMDGCTFSVGGQNPQTAPLVAHANKQTGGEIDQIGIEEQLDAVYNGDGYKMLTKPMYTGSKHFNVGSGHVRATTFGVSDGTTWGFWAQVWEDYHKAVANRAALDNPDAPGYGNAAWDKKFKKNSNSYELLGVKRLRY